MHSQDVCWCILRLTKTETKFQNVEEMPLMVKMFVMHLIYRIQTSQNIVKLPALKPFTFVSLRSDKH